MAGTLMLILFLAFSVSLPSAEARHKDDHREDMDDETSDYWIFRRFLNDMITGSTFDDDDQAEQGEQINLATCGQSSSPGNRVIGGADATLGEWPWQAQLIENGNFACGGSLITQTWVMTAAHCIPTTDPSKYKVVLGDVHRDKVENSEQELQVKKIVVHPAYNDPVPINNDIALIQLADKARETSFVGTVCLPQEGYSVPPGTHCYISGWGQVAHPAEAAVKLQQAALPIVTNRVCQAKHWTSRISIPGKTAVTSAMLCAGDAGKTLKGACFGDSGGPFVCKNAAGQWVQQGIVSWGDSACSSKSHFSVFTRVSQFRKWIEDVINE